MMTVLRECIACLLFLAGIGGIVELFSAGLEWQTLLLTIICFLSAHFIWPSKRKNQRKDDSRFLDWIEVFIELPIEIFTWLFRLLGRLFGGKGDGVDIDL